MIIYLIEVEGVTNSLGASQVYVTWYKLKVKFY